MTEQPHDRDLPPEVDNSEQDDEEEQAQTVAGEARNHATDPDFGNSEKVPSGDDSDDVPDLVDRIKQMNSSGRIDMDAYRGEPNHDDEDDTYGSGSRDGNGPDNDD